MHQSNIISISKSRSEVECDAPVLKHQTSFQHPLSSQPPNNQAILSTRVTLCARMLCEGNVPQTGALLQYMTDAGASSALFEWAKCGIMRKRGTDTALGSI